LKTVRYKDSVDPVTTDGRNIDRKTAILSGEAGGQRARASDKHLDGIAQTWTALPEPDSADPTYYDRPLLKEPVWAIDIPLYYYVGGVTGASLALGAATQLNPSEGLNGLARRCHWVGLIGASISAGFLVHDLGRPSRFLNMLRVFRPTSPMNMGAWILSGVPPTAFGALLFTGRSRPANGIGRAFGYASGLFGLGLATYTGVLVANSVIPLWQETRHVLPVLFGASAMAGAGSLFDMIGTSPEEGRTVATFGNIGKAAELAFSILLETHVSSVPRVAEPLKKGASGAMWRAAAFLTASSLVVSLLPRTSRKKRFLSGLLGSLGSLCMRCGIHYAGVASSRDARASFHSQRLDHDAVEMVGASSLQVHNQQAS
jgi:formate-dependent nitrite reductase membrane component NrfD